MYGAAPYRLMNLLRFCASSMAVRREDSSRWVSGSVYSRVFEGPLGRPRPSISAREDPLRRTQNCSMPERPRRHTVGPINLNLENEVAARALRHVHDTTRIGGNRSDNEIRADDITRPLFTPCVAVIADVFHLTQEGVRWKRISIESHAG